MITKSERLNKVNRIIAVLLVVEMIITMIPNWTMVSAGESNGGGTTTEVTIKVTDEFNRELKDAEIVFEYEGIIEENKITGKTNESGNVTVNLDNSKSWICSVTPSEGLQGYSSILSHSISFNDESTWLVKLPYSKITIEGTVQDDKGNLLKSADVTLTCKTDSQIVYEKKTGNEELTKGKFSVEVASGREYRIEIAMAATEDTYYESYNADTVSTGVAYTLNSRELQDDDTLKFSMEGSQPFEISYDDTTFSNVVSSEKNRDLNISYTSSDTSIVEVDNDGKITIKENAEKEREVTITANVAADDTYKAKQIEYTLKVIKANQAEFKFATTGRVEISYTRSDYQNIASGGTGDGGITYSASNEEVVSVSETGEITPKKVGQATITATKEGNENYNSISATYEIEVTPADQEKLEFDKAVVNKDFEEEGIEIELSENSITNIDALGYKEGAVSYSVSCGEDTAILTGEKLAVKKPAAIVVTVTKSGGTNYNSAKGTYQLNIKRPQSDFAFNLTASEVEVTYGDNSNVYTDNKANGGSGTGEIEYFSDNTEIAEVDNNGDVTIKRAGKVKITATKTEENDSEYASASASYILNISKADRVLTFDNDNPNDIKYGQSYTNEAKIKDNKYFGNKYNVKYDIVQGGDYVDIDASTGKITAKKPNAGTDDIVEIRALVEEDEAYKEVSKTYKITINKADQNIKFPQNEYQLTYGENFKESEVPTASKEGIYAAYGPTEITYSVEKDEAGIVNRIDGKTGQLYFNDKKTGMAIIKATLTGNGLFEEATTTYTVKVAEFEVTDEEKGNLYTISNGNKVAENSGWYKSVTIVAKDGYCLSESKSVENSNEWKDRLEYVSDMNKTVEFYARKKNEAGTLGGVSQKLTETVKIDNTNPTCDDIVIVSSNGREKSVKASINKFLSLIGVISKEDSQFIVKVTGIKDDTSGIAKVEYCTSDINTKYDEDSIVDSEIQWENIYENLSEQGDVEFSLGTDKNYNVYVKLTDVAGNIAYYSTDGLITDEGDISVKLSVIGSTSSDSDKIYKGDVTIEAKVTKNINTPYSEIKKVEWATQCDDEKYDELTWNTLYDDSRKSENQNKPQITEDGKKYEFTSQFTLKNRDSDAIKVYLRVTDNVETKVAEEPLLLKIDNTLPKIEVSFDNNTCIEWEEDGITRGYYKSARMATISITEKHFDSEKATQAIKQAITAKTAQNVIDELEWSKDGDKYITKIEFSEDDNYTFNPIEYADEAGNINDVEESYYYAEGTRTPVYFTVDTSEPVDNQIKINNDTWKELISTLTFGRFGNREYKVTISSSDVTSPYNIYYYIDKYSHDEKNPSMKTKEELDKLGDGESGWKIYREWNKETKKVSISDNQAFVVYAKIVDYAGNTAYINSNGYIYDNTNPGELTVVPERECNLNGYYNEDVNVNIKVRELPDATYSGINKIEYWVVKPGEAKSDDNKINLFNFSESDSVNNNASNVSLTGEEAAYSDLKHDFNDTITVKAQDYNSDNVKVYVRVTDNAGNVTDNDESPLVLNIDITEPEINISFDNNDYKKIVKTGDEDRGYYENPRTATITVKERSTGFDEDEIKKGITITAKDVNGKIIKDAVDLSKLSWTHSEGKTPDAAEHKAVITFDTDANYEFTVEYEDKAGNSNKDVKYADGTETPVYFTIDKSEPVVDNQIKINNDTWKELISTLTFGRFGNREYKVTISSSDATSPYNIYYYIDEYSHDKENPSMKTKEELDKLGDGESGWKIYKEWNKEEEEVSISDNKAFVVYAKIVDYAGNTAYINSNGYIYDDTKPGELTVEPESKCNSNGYYNEDVNVNITVKELPDATYSGINKIEYWVIKDDEEKSDKNKMSLFNFSDRYSVNSNASDVSLTGKEAAYSELQHDFNGTITVKAQDYNSDNVKVYVRVTDNAGNVTDNDESPLELKIDITKPEINISFDNNDYNKIVKTGDENRGYYAKPRTATITVKERSTGFNEERIKEGIKITAKDVNGNDIKDAVDLSELSWTHSEGKTPDAAEHKAVITFDTNANYEFAVEYNDEAGNSNEKVNYANGTETPVRFTVDTTQPDVSVSFDNNDCNIVKDSDGDRGYYSESRTATITIYDATSAFDTNNAKIKITAKDSKNRDVKQPNISWQATSDKSVNKAIILFSDDANYTFEISYADNAGNTNKIVDFGKSKTPQRFTVDKNKPSTGTITIQTRGINSYASQQKWQDVDKWINNKNINEKITFGRWTNDEVIVSGEADDSTSPLEDIYYYVTPNIIYMNEGSLDKLGPNEWKKLGTQVILNPNRQFTVYLKIQDYAGNYTYISSNGVILDNNGPDITIEPENYADDKIYDSDVSVKISVKDNESGGTSSGIKSVEYSVYNMNNLTLGEELYSFKINNPKKEDLVNYFEKEVIISANDNNSNDVRIEVKAIDNANNERISTKTIKIDTTAPSINVSYSNNDGDSSFAGETLFRESRTAKIIVTERNFNPSKVKIYITNTENTIPTISDWTDYEGTGNGDDARHEAIINYTADGDYTFDIEYTDEAGNTLEKPVDYSNQLAPTAFTIDRTAPNISISYDNNNSENGNFFKNDRNATITIMEHNFETSRVNVTITATDDGRQIGVPGLTAWSSDGDIHRASINFREDGLYMVNVEYTDKAGNRANTVEIPNFYVDKTKPEITVRGITDNSANSTAGNVGFVLECTDTNMDIFEPVLTTIVKENGKFVTKKIDGEFSTIKNGKTFTVTNLPEDGIYTLKCKAIDKAGNEYNSVSLSDKSGKVYTESRTSEDALVTFSVNREGSTFMPTKAIESLVDNYYVKAVSEDLILIETNADKLKRYVVRLNGKELIEGTDYKVDIEGGNGQWYKYTYTISKALFEEEGEYKLVVESMDAAETTAYSDVKNLDISFVVDRTPPIVTISGVKNDGRYRVEKQIVTAIPTDNGGKLYRFKAVILDASGNILREYSWVGDELTEYLNNNGGIITFEIPEGLDNQLIITCEDSAFDADGNGNVYEVTYRRITVSTNKWIIFYANKPLFYGSIIGAVAVFAAIILLIGLLKRRNRSR